MRESQRPGVRTFHVRRRDSLLAAEQQELLELAAKEPCPPRIIERQRGQRVDHAIRAGIAAVQRLHADDGDDDLRWNAEFTLRALQHSFVLAQERNTAVDSRRTEKLRRVLEPLRRRKHGTRHRRDDLGLIAHLHEQTPQLAFVEGMIACHLGDEPAHVRSRGVAARLDLSRLDFRGPRWRNRKRRECAYTDQAPRP